MLLNLIIVLLHLNTNVSFALLTLFYALLTYRADLAFQPKSAKDQQSKIKRNGKYVTTDKY